MKLLTAPDGPVCTVDLQYGRRGCVEHTCCTRFVGKFMQRMVGRYVAEGKPFRRQIESAVLDLTDFEYDEYMARVKKVHKGAALRQARKSDRAGFVCHQFHWRNHLPDVHEINTSMDVRSGGEMKPAYRKSVEEMGGAPVKERPVKVPKCPNHCVYTWGIFEPRPGYTQGEIVTNEKLLGYIKLKRQGGIGIYTRILGHGDYLQHGIMYRLHYAIMEWIGRHLPNELAGLEQLLYGGVESGAGGLQMFKKRCLFDGAYLVLAERPELPEA